MILKLFSFRDIKFDKFLNVIFKTVYFLILEHAPKDDSYAEPEVFQEVCIKLCIFNIYCFHLSNILTFVMSYSQALL